MSTYGQYLRLNVMKMFIRIYELETKNLQRSLTSLQIKVHYCKVDLKYFSSSTRYNLHCSLTKIFSSMISFQQEMLLSERHKNTCNKLTETGNFWVAQFLKLFFADLEIPFNY